MEAVIYSTIIAPEDDQSFLTRFHAFLKSLPVFDILRIETYISKEDRNVAKLIKKNNRGQSGFIANDPSTYYEHYHQREEEEETSLLEEEATTLLMEEQEEETTLLEEGTVLLKENSIMESPHYASLTRIVNNECIDINKPVFRIGKERSYVDYFVSNNQTVSRSHADIITRADCYFIYDHNSTNHTYVNDTMVPIKMEIQIYDGDLLRLANEEFIFHT